MSWVSLRRLLIYRSDFSRRMRLCRLWINRLMVRRVLDSVTLTDVSGHLANLCGREMVVVSVKERRRYEPTNLYRRNVARQLIAPHLLTPPSPGAQEWNGTTELRRIWNDVINDRLIGLSPHRP